MSQLLHQIKHFSLGKIPAYAYPVVIFSTSLLFMLLVVIFSDISPSIASVYQAEPPYLVTSNNKMTEHVISGFIVAKANNLGIISVSFKSVGKVVGMAEFSLFESGNSEPFFARQYDAEQFNQIDFFPFGFSIQNNSKNKKYTFILSFSTSREGSLDLGSIPYISKYSFKLKETIHSEQFLTDYLLMKIQYSIKEPNSRKLLLFILSWLPLYLFVTNFSRTSRIITSHGIFQLFFFSKLHNKFGALFYFLISLDVIILKTSSDFFICALMVYFLCLRFYYKLELIFYKSILRLLFTLAIFSSLTGIQIIVEKSALWLFIFAIVYLIEQQSTYE